MGFQYFESAFSVKCGVCTIEGPLSRCIKEVGGNKALFLEVNLTILDVKIKMYAL